MPIVEGAVSATSTSCSFSWDTYQHEDQRALLVYFQLHSINQSTVASILTRITVALQCAVLLALFHGIDNRSTTDSFDLIRAVATSRITRQYIPCHSSQVAECETVNSSREECRMTTIPSFHNLTALRRADLPRPTATMLKDIGCIGPLHLESSTVRRLDTAWPKTSSQLASMQSMQSSVLYAPVISSSSSVWSCQLLYWNL